MRFSLAVTPPPHQRPAPARAAQPAGRADAPSAAEAVTDAAPIELPPPDLDQRVRQSGEW